MTPAERVAQMTWRWVDGDTAAVLTWLTRLGCTVRVIEAGERGEGRSFAVDGPQGMTVGLEFPPPDPVGVIVSLGFVLFGLWWPQVVPQALPLVTTEWRRRARAARQEGRRAR
jgi:hypothetical protein